MTRARWFLFITPLYALLLGGCRSEERPTPPPQQATEPPREPPPLETVTLQEEKVVPVREERGPASNPVGVPCAWARIWSVPGGPKPMPVGGMVKAPKKIHTAEPVLPYRKTKTEGTPVLEVIIDTQGHVAEARVLQSFDPPWPEADAALLDAVLGWVYEPSIIDGKPAPICMKIPFDIEWTDVQRE